MEPKIILLSLVVWLGAVASEERKYPENTAAISSINDLAYKQPKPLNLDPKIRKALLNVLLRLEEQEKVREAATKKDEEKYSYEVMVLSDKKKGAQHSNTERIPIQNVKSKYENFNGTIRYTGRMAPIVVPEGGIFFKSPEDNDLRLEESKGINSDYREIVFPAGKEQSFPTPPPTEVYDTPPPHLDFSTGSDVNLESRPEGGKEVKEVETTTLAVDDKETNETKVEFFAAPLLTAFTLEQDETGIPKRLIPLANTSALINPSPRPNFQKVVPVSNFVPPQVSDAFIKSNAFVGSPEDEAFNPFLQGSRMQAEIERQLKEVLERKRLLELERRKFLGDLERRKQQYTQQQQYNHQQQQQYHQQQQYNQRQQYNQHQQQNKRYTQQSQYDQQKLQHQRYNQQFSQQEDFPIFGNSVEFFPSQTVPFNGQLLEAHRFRQSRREPQAFVGNFGNNNFQNSRHVPTDQQIKSLFQNNGLASNTEDFNVVSEVLSLNHKSKREPRDERQGGRVAVPEADPTQNSIPTGVPGFGEFPATLPFGVEFPPNDYFPTQQNLQSVQPNLPFQANLPSIQPNLQSKQPNFPSQPIFPLQPNFPPQPNYQENFQQPSSQFRPPAFMDKFQKAYFGPPEGPQTPIPSLTTSKPKVSYRGKGTKTEAIFHGSKRPKSVTKKQNQHHDKRQFRPSQPYNDDNINDNYLRKPSFNLLPPPL